MKKREDFSNKSTWIVYLYFNPKSKKDIKDVKTKLKKDFDKIDDYFLKSIINLSEVNWDEFYDTILWGEDFFQWRKENIGIVKYYDSIHDNIKYYWRVVIRHFKDVYEIYDGKKRFYTDCTNKEIDAYIVETNKDYLETWDYQKVFIEISSKCDSDGYYSTYWSCFYGTIKNLCKDYIDELYFEKNNSKKIQLLKDGIRKYINENFKDYWINIERKNLYLNTFNAFVKYCEIIDEFNDTNNKKYNYFIELTIKYLNVKWDTNVILTDNTVVNDFHYITSKYINEIYEMVNFKKNHEENERNQRFRIENSKKESDFFNYT